MTSTAVSHRKVLLAEPRGFCAGVSRAIAIVERALELYGAPVYVRKEIVHNHYVVRGLQRRGVVFVDSEADVPPGAVCVFSAHGVSPEVRDNAAGRDLTVVDATCPLVAKVHQEARRFTRDGRTILLIGHADHEEVEGTAGEAPENTIVVESAAAVDRLNLAADTPVAVLSQTTLALDDTRDTIAALNGRFTDIAGPGADDVCYASQNRQNAVKLLAARCDLVLVVGSTNSSNSVRMVEVARGAGTAAYLVPEAGLLDERWLCDVETVGVSSGASAPEILVDQLLDRLSALGYDDVELCVSTTEDVVFRFPAMLGGDPAPA
jgi:4-hydroxy-3-methylbut-2-enyl diphosphate reductase